MCWAPWRFTSAGPAHPRFRRRTGPGSHASAPLWRQSPLDPRTALRPLPHGAVCPCWKVVCFLESHFVQNYISLQTSILNATMVHRRKPHRPGAGPPKHARRPVRQRVAGMLGLAAASTTLPGTNKHAGRSGVRRGQQHSTLRTAEEPPRWPWRSAVSSRSLHPVHAGPRAPIPPCREMPAVSPDI